MMSKIKKSIQPFLVKIILSYFRLMSKIQLRKYKLLNSKLKIIGVSGSSGKTSTMNAIYAVLKDKYKVKYSYKANSETGIPLDILGFSMPDKYTKFEWIKYILLTPLMLLFNWRKYDIYIVEMGVDGISEPKNMKYLLKILVPDIAVYLNVDTVHGANYEYKLNNPKLTSELGNIVGPNNSEIFEYIDTYNPAVEEEFGMQVMDLIARDKNLLISNLPQNGLAVLNMNDSRVALTKQIAKCEVIEVFGEDTFNYIYPLPYHYNLCFEIAIKIGTYFKIPKNEAILNIRKNFKLEPGRCTLLKGINNSMIIDSSYNSSPTALKDLIEYLSNFENIARQSNFRTNSFFTNPSLPVEKIAVLGDMRELGKNSPLSHKKLAEFSAGKISKYFLVGPEMQKYFKPKLLELGIPDSQITTGLFAKDLIAEIKKYLESTNTNKLILVKGSQNTIFLETIVTALLENPDDEKKLCRRGTLWDNIRNNNK